MEVLVGTFGCQIGTFPFTYLGLPMGTTKLKVEDFLPLVQRIERRLTTTSNFLTQASRMEMVNSILSALPTFYMGKIKIPPTVIKQIDKYKKHCMWRGADLNARKPPLATWKLATRPKKEGGLGILNLETQNDSLLLKICINSIIKLISFGSNSSGQIITEMESYLTIGQEAHSGGEES
jgi:hypothetical protein